ncbi:hypothetical protein [Helicobacter pylori]|uniref:hypothetical protein n=1 Tax=Helicobacter pylori TaxID=210 RepID=UPI001F181152|nr:hypothetical protein [Helicobacter pylori]
MRQTNETAKSFNQLKEITQSIQAYQTPTQANKNAKESELTHKQALKPKDSTQAKKGALKPTKRAFSERQKTTLKKPQASANARLKTKQGLKNSQSQQKGGDHEG